MILALALGCSATQDKPTAARLLCYAAADQAAQARVDAECGDVVFDQCPEFESILDELREAQEECP